MLLPKRVKYRRVHRGRLKGKAYRGYKVTYGDYGLQALEPAWITSNQIESARIAMTRYICWPRDSGLPRQPHRRSRDHAGGRHRGARLRPFRCIHRRV